MSVEAEHVLVAGPSGGGKTTYLRELHAKHDGPSIFLTVKKNERKAQSNPPHRIVKSSASYPEDIRQSFKWAVRKHGITQSEGEKVQIVIDEVQNAPTFHGEDGFVKHLLHEERERTKTVIATQNPQDLHTSKWKYGPLQQTKNVVWVGPSRTWHRGFREWLNLDSDQLPKSNYQYHVIEPSDPPTVVYRGETNKRYG